MRILAYIILGSFVLYLLLYGIMELYWLYFSYIVNKKKKSGEIISTPETDERPVYGYVIPARNEENVIAELIESIYAQDYPKDKMRVFVIADNCTDKTAEIAEKAGASVIIRNDSTKARKGYALEYFFDKVLYSEEYKDIKGYVIFDADNVLSRDFTLKMNKEVANGAKVAMGYRNCKNWDGGLMAAWNGLFYLNESINMNLARTIVDDYCMLSGTGIFIDRELLIKMGGYHFTCITEDLELTIRLCIMDEKIVFCPDAVFFDEQVTTWKSSVKQRSRWIRGASDIAKIYFKDFMDGIFKKKKLKFYDLFFMMINSGYAAAICSVLTVLSMISIVCLFPSIKTLLLVIASCIALYYVNFFIIFTVPILKSADRVPIEKKLKNLAIITYPFYILSYLFISVKTMLFTKEMKWEQIAHGAVKK